MSDLARDLRLGLRAIAQTPIVSLLAILSLGLAIAGNTTVFSIVDALLLRPLPFRDPDRLVLLWEANPSNPVFDISLSSADNFLDLRDGSSAFEHLSAIMPAFVSLTAGDRPEPVTGVAVTDGFFEIFGEPAALGRTLEPADYEEGNDRVVVLSHGLWRRRFAADAALVGNSIQLSGEPHRVVGVMAEGFETLDPRLDLWKPMVLRRGEMPRDLKVMTVVGRLRRDVPIQQARQELAVLASRLSRAYPDTNRGFGVRLLTMREQLARGGTRELMALLQGALLFVLLIASANIANLYLARGVDRQREFAVRTAMGASRARILRQLLLESFIPAFAAGAFGTIASLWGIRLLGRAFADQLSTAFAPRIDARVFLFSIAVTILAGLAFGIAPALTTARSDLTGSLHEGGRGGTGAQRRLVTKSFVVAEVALALVMLAGAGILVRTFAAAQRLDVGISMENILVFQLELSDERYEEPADRSAFLEELRGDLEALPGVRAATTVDHLPRSPFPPATSFQIPDRTPADEKPTASVVTVGPGYLDVFAVRLLQGRSFQESDRLHSPAVAMINEAMASSFFPGASPLGETIQVYQRSLEIVGVVGNVREDIFRFDVEVSQPIVYLPQAQSPTRHVAVALRSQGDPLEIAGPARDCLWRIDPKLSADEFQTMEKFVAQFLVGMRVLNRILSGFGGLALLLAAIGIYGVIAFSVSRRTREIGLRMALGARGGDVLKLVVREGLVLVLIGFGIGIPGILVTNRLISAGLSGISPFATSTAVVIGAGLFLVALLACYVPARRAASLHPAVALRTE